MIVNILLGIGIVITCMIVGLFIYFLMISQGKIKPYYNENGQILENSIAEKIKIKINGVENGMFIRGKSLDNPVILFVSSGPGTPDYFLNEAYPKMNLEDNFIVCNWEYRGTGMVYDSNIDPRSITADQMIKDTLAVTEYLKERFHKEKIYIMGFSGGTNIGLQTVAKYPDNYFAYIAMAQFVTGGPDNDTLIYNFMKKVFSERNDKRKLNKLEDSVVFEENGKVTCKDWPSYCALLHEAGGGTIKDKTEFKGVVIPIGNCHCYTMKEKIDYIKGFKMYRKTPFYQECMKQDYRKTIQKVDIPIYFISGSYDYNCPWPLVEEYYNMIDAPKKDFFLIDNAAHSPLWEQSEVVVPIIKDKICIEQ